MDVDARELSSVVYITVAGKRLIVVEVGARLLWAQQPEHTF